MKKSVKNVHEKLKNIQKILIYFLMLILLCLMPCFDFDNENICFATSDEQVSNKRFAKAKENCFLFKTSDVSSVVCSNVYFCVPESYFVTILAEQSSSVFKVEYKGKIGFVSADTVVVATFVPVVPTLDDVTVDIGESSGTQLRSSPLAQNNSNVLKILPAGTKNLEYVSFISSEKPAHGTSDVWFFVLFFPEDDPTAVFEGYVYSEKTCNLSKISKNLEANPELKNDVLGDEKEIALNRNVKIILLILILIPIVLVFVIVALRSNKILKKKRIENQNVEPENEEIKPPKTVKFFKGKQFVLKNKDQKNDVEFQTEVGGVEPIFPTYEIVDDDDLL